MTRFANHFSVKPSFQNVAKRNGLMVILLNPGNPWKYSVSAREITRVPSCSLRVPRIKGPLAPRLPGIFRRLSLFQFSFLFSSLRNGIWVYHPEVVLSILHTLILESNQEWWLHQQRKGTFAARIWSSVHPEKVKSLKFTVLYLNQDSKSINWTLSTGKKLFNQSSADWTTN